eukprot:CAMPEP_0180142838 /NCGR_PEP_ID=MMETSP0986-20121125/15838_1 /TAXON_ID=697907 /ORGANISM="non described non described, Strain CCMP2293" /LENGTH=282 /DNA_ID=CAMNT_0022086151 /DNA_START=51 /DNA_END=899 /DNA_ORIENTATION=+
MGAVESCCGKRGMMDRLPVMPSQPISALGNQYVTFNPEQPELFTMAKRVWFQSAPFDVQDVSQNDWFKIEGKDAKWTGQKKLVLNTGVPHCTIERRNFALWHMYVGHERRASIRREAPNGKTVYVILLHQSPFPSRSSDDDAGSQEPALVAHGDFLACQYWFQEVQSREQRRVARVDPPETERKGGQDNYQVAIAPLVDVALILLCSLAIDTCEQEEANADGAESLGSGRESTLDSSRTDDRWRHSLDPIPIQMPVKGGAAPKIGGVPPLWHKGKTPRGGPP